MTIKKRGEKYGIYSETTDESGKRKRLGEYKTRKGAEKRLQQIEAFKHKSK